MDPMTSIGGRFVPPSAKDFSVRARRLSLLTDQPLQRIQEWLSRLYGFSNAHELRQSLKRPASPGPYDEALDDGGARRLQGFRVALAAQRPRDPVQAFKCDLVPDMGLFASPEGHEERYAKVGALVDFYMPRGGEAAGPSYANAGYSSAGEAVLYRTPLGKTVYDAVGRAMDLASGAERITRLKDLARQHPLDPWLQAELLDEELETAAGLGGLVKRAETQRLYRRSRKVVALFRKLYGDKEHLAIATKLIVNAPFGADAYGYARALAIAGRLAMTTGDHGDAVRKFQRLLRMDRTPRLPPEPISRDPMGVERFFDVARLNIGRWRSRARVRPDLENPYEERRAWRVLCDFAACVAAGDAMDARIRLADVLLVHGRSALRADLAEGLTDDPERPSFNFIDLGLLDADKVFLATAPLWRAQETLSRLILEVLKDRAVARAEAALVMLSVPGDRAQAQKTRLATMETLERAIDRAWARKVQGAGR
ncbi:hypothetical protein [Caulobacter sp. FWC26]|uniref:hypothetical protein n=1 Tax=Caulobacter sp. FWC26 TaxID=69665 RepID=UPI000C151C5A|nr:hypothetical protein [Caulobacter sp. FWC26]AZS19403.1 hypothetical protein CSW63_01380 [Caulobacter sp. FWC26]